MGENNFRFFDPKVGEEIAKEGRKYMDSLDSQFQMVIDSNEIMTRDIQNNTEVIKNQIDPNKVSELLKELEGKELFANKIEYAKNTLSKLKTLP